jgi:integrase
MATIEQRQGPDRKPVYRVRVRRKGTPLQTATFPKLADAKRWAQMMEGRVVEGRHFPSTMPTRHTLAEALDRYTKEVLPHKGTHMRYNQPYQLQWWHKQLGPYFLSDLTPALIVRFRDTLAETRAPASVRAYLSTLSHVLTIASNEWNWLDHSPMPKVRKLKLPRGRVRFLSDEERTSLLRACQGSHNPYLYTVVVLALSTGARRGELLTLRWSDVDLKRKMLTFRETKNGETRSAPLTGNSFAVLAQHAKVRRLNTALVFLDRTGTRPLGIRGAFDNAVERAGIADFHFYDLRHSFASYLAMNGASLLEIAEVLGHKTLAMVRRYAHLSEAHTRGVVERMHRAVFGEP